MITGTQYCIFRVGEKYKDIKAIKGFEGHMTRTFYTPNADQDKVLKNEILIGDKDIVKDAEKYIEGIKLRKNGVIARDLLLTASPQFFKNKSYGFIKKWINSNINFLKTHFGDNLRFAVIHLDETTPHIHALIVPKFENTRGKEKYKLSNSLYFDGREKLSEWQDLYSNHIKSEFEELNRGIKGSKARHVKIKQYYTLVNAKLDEKDMTSVLAKASNSVLLEKQVNNLQKLLKENLQKNSDRKEIVQLIGELKQDKEIYKETIKAMSQAYKISQESIINIVKSVEDKVKNNEKEQGIERVKEK